MEENKVPIEYKNQLLTYLDQILSLYSSKIVGKLMKRFEIIQDRETLKSECRELIYENFRDLKEVFEAFGEGIETTIFNFKTKNKEK
jgi:hypothetical protein